MSPCVVTCRRVKRQVLTRDSTIGVPLILSGKTQPTLAQGRKRKGILSHGTQESKESFMPQVNADPGPKCYRHRPSSTLLPPCEPRPSFRSPTSSPVAFPILTSPIIKHQRGKSTLHYSQKEWESTWTGPVFPRLALDHR